MSEVTKQAITRTVTLSDLTPAELASIFAAFDDHHQAAFFDALADEVKDWPGTGWSMQCCYFVPKLGDRGRAVLADMAEYLA